jgi:L-asparaginase
MVTIAAMTTSHHPAAPAESSASGRRSRPRIALLATGGTIAGVAADALHTAGYQAGALGVEHLLEAVPALDALAVIEAEQLASIDSKDMSYAVWNALSARLEMLLARDDIDGVVITHGTDTLEETAFLLHLTVKSRKPVVLTAAMRPATALSADGPLNLCQAVMVAADPDAAGRGVLVVVNGQIHGARDVSKRNATAVQAFESPEFGALGWVQDARVEFQRSLSRPHTLATPFTVPAEWPEVALVLSYSGVTRVAVDALVAAGVRGLVVAGTGNGSIHAALQQALGEAAAHGVAVVRASRTGAGHVMRNGAAPDDALGLVAAGTLSPYKARVLLILALAGNGDRPLAPAALQALFDTY